MLLDIGIGIISSIFLSHAFGISLSTPFLGFGVLFSLLPDVDFLFLKTHQHRDILHYPLLIIPIGTLITSLFSYQLAMLFALVTFLHFLHDSIGVGWGIRWLYPFSQNYYAFFYQYDLAKHNMPHKLIYDWSPADVERLSSRYGDKNWIKNIYLKFHPYALVEFFVFALALITLLLYR
jgi:hypothetical protein